MRRHSVQLIVAWTLAGTSLATYAQSPDQTKCTLSGDQAPAPRGIRLGMNAEQVFTMFPGSGEWVDNKRSIASAAGYPNFGVSRLSLYPAALSPEAQQRLANVDSISLTLFDGRVTEINVSYASRSSNPSGPTWPAVDDFVAKLSEAFALPAASAWIAVNMSSRTIRCDGFDVTASTSGAIGSIVVRDNRLALMDIVEKRRADDEARLRREFKP